MHSLCFLGIVSVSILLAVFVNSLCNLCNASDICVLFGRIPVIASSRFPAALNTTFAGVNVGMVRYFHRKC